MKTRLRISLKSELTYSTEQAQNTIQHIRSEARRRLQRLSGDLARDENPVQSEIVFILGLLVDLGIQQDRWNRASRDAVEIG
jgi:hypothetical protein